MNRRTLLTLPALAAAPSGKAAPATALSLNEDPNHFFASRAGQHVTRGELVAWVDQYAGTQVRELIINVNAQRTAFDSHVWTPFWKDYDPNGAEDQPLFASLAPADRKAARGWIDTAWQIHHDGFDHIAIWLGRARERGLSPWVSIRMNDLHNVDDERHPLHSDFWRAHPEFRRISYRGEMRDKALDFGHAEVRDYTFALIDEVASRYPFDGIELDWMRHGFHFAPGWEDEGREHLNGFMARVRRRVGPSRKIGVRVPPHPETALRLGMDAVTWAREGNCDFVVPTNFWRTVDTAMPVRLWRQMLPAACLLGAGLELGLNPYVGSKMAGDKPFGFNSLATVRGAAAAYLHEGANRVYLFNYMDSQTAIEDLNEYQPLLHETGELETLKGKTRRHVVTYTDTQAPGEPVASLLPVTLGANSWRAFRLAIGPADGSLTPLLRLGVDGDPSKWSARVNGTPARFAGLAEPDRPWPNCRVWKFAVPGEALRSGDCVVEVTASTPGTVQWVEIALQSSA